MLQPLNKYIFIILLILIQYKSASALDPIVLSDNNKEYLIGPSLEYLIDSDKKFTINDIKSQKFIPYKENTLDLGLTESNVWVRFSVKNDLLLTQDWLLEIGLAAIGNIELYLPNEKGGFDKKITGYLQPLEKREKPHRFFIFNMPRLSTHSKTFYICFNSQDAIAIPMSIMTQERFYNKDYLRQYSIGIYYGILLVMILYNLFIYASLRDLSYLYYVLYFICFLFVQSFNDGIFYGYLLTDLKGFNVQTECFFIAATIFWGIIFSVTFLRTVQYAPMLDRILRFLAIIFVLLGLMSFFISANRLQMILFIFILIAIPIVLISGAMCLIRGYRPARFYLLAAFLFLSGVALMLLADLSIIPMSFIAEHGMRLGSTFDVTLLSLALADRINIMKSELIENAEFKLKAEAELAKSHKLESIALLAGGMAHDLNNILTGLFMKVQLTAKFIKKDVSKAEGYLLDVKNIYNMAKNIVNRLQTFSKGDALFIKQAFLPKLLRETGNFVLSGSNSTYELTILHDLWPLEFDESQLNQVITNILINADQSMPDGGNINVIVENIEIIDYKMQGIHTGLLLHGKYVKITIKDNGHGISKENISKIFDPFFTTKNTGQGLGLAISYSIIKKHNGHIDVESEEGKGTSFFIYLPASESAEINTETELILDDRQLLGRSILIMDDNETLLEGITAILSEKGCIVDVARNGEEAIDLYKKGLNSEEPYDIIIIDVTISGGMGGVITIKQLKELDPNVQAIVSSGYSEIPVMSNFRQYGFIAALPKPYTVEELCFLLQKSLKHEGSALKYPQSDSSL
ncbi:MAG: response regulator [Nitrospirae bacterium]|nr:response regulator [Nitrospirota bacterium]